MNKTIKSIALVLTLGFALCACGCAAKTSLYEQGLELIGVISEMTRTGGYTDVYTGRDEVKEIISELSKNDYSAPKTVYSITLDDDSLLQLLPGLENAEGMSEDLKKILKQRAFAAIITQLNGRNGADGLVAASVCSASKTFVCADHADSIYLYVYENSAPAAVTFTVGDDGAVLAGASFVMYDGLPCGSAGELEDFFSDYNVKIEEVSR